MRRVLFVLLLLIPFTVSGQEVSKGPLFMKDMLNETEFFDPWGVGLDFFTMEQDYKIKKLQFDLPGVDITDPSLIGVTNDLNHYDLKFDVWLTPFLNVFALLGRVDADTYVDLGAVPVTGLPVELGVLPVSYEGTVYGGGVNLVYGTERWFVALNNTWTGTNLSGNFDSSVSAFISQPRIGLVKDRWTFYAGGMYLDTTEKHSGTIALPIPGIPPVAFDVELESADKWNYAVGIFHVFSPRAHLLLEYGFGDRTHTLFNFTYRF
jgi:hypothetical protein